MGDTDYMGLLTTGARQLGVELDPGSCLGFERFTDMLLDWNSRMNLTAIEDRSEIVKLHYLDSLSCLAKAKQYIENGDSIIDVGTGAGFPGIPFLLADESLKVTFLDSLRKRLGFIEAVVSELGLPPMEYVHGRAEDAGQDREHREVYDVAVSRAVARLGVLVELCIPFVRVGGCFIAMKGPGVTEEMEGGIRAAARMGARHVETLHFMLPFDAGERNLVVFRKDRPTDRKYPRKAGIPAKEPL